MPAPARARAISSGPKEPGTLSARWRAVIAPKKTITVSSNSTSQIESTSKISLIA